MLGHPERPIVRYMDHKQKTCKLEIIKTKTYWAVFLFIWQTILSLCISMSFFCIGLVRGYSAPAVPSILENDPDLLPTTNIASWASMYCVFRIYKSFLFFHTLKSSWFHIMLFKGSIPPCGAFFGSLIAGFLLHYIGRKKTILTASPIWTAAWILVATASDYKIIIVGRFFSGFSVGLCLPSAQVYVSTDKFFQLVL